MGAGPRAGPEGAAGPPESPNAPGVFDKSRVIFFALRRRKVQAAPGRAFLDPKRGFGGFSVLSIRVVNDLAKCLFFNLSSNYF